MHTQTRTHDPSLAVQVKLSSAPNLGEHFRISRKDEKILRKKPQFTILVHPGTTF